jgi:hypothetical protein
LEAITAILKACGELDLVGAQLSRQDVGSALSAVAKLMRNDPKNSNLWCTLGVCYWRNGEWERAAQAFRHAIALSQEAWPALVGLACILLTQGRFAEGWRAFRGRWQMQGWIEDAMFPMTSSWDGIPREGSSVLLWCGKDLGAAIMFARVLPWLSARGMNVKLCAPPALEPLFKAQWPDLIHGPNDRYYDSHLPIADVFSVWQGEPIGTLSHVGAYLTMGRSAAQRAECMHVGLAVGSSGTSIGKAIADGHWQRLTEIAGVKWHDLREDIGAEPDGTEVLRAAKVIAGLDLVITTDSLIAHLAGALGRPVWLAVGPVPEPTWLLGRTDSPWYASMRIFRCESTQEPDGVVSRIAAEVATHGAAIAILSAE